ncbi:MAG: DNA-binding protein [Methylocystaceae bacterium]|nr:MAG: DNA-binding protein [Methylocystaceae bacterium]
MPAAIAELGVSERQLRDLIRDGKIPFVNVGLAGRPAYRLRPVDIEAFIIQRTGICQKSEVSTNAAAPAIGSTTSKSEVVDFAARRAQRTGRTQKSGRQKFPRAKPGRPEGR